TVALLPNPYVRERPMSSDNGHDDSWPTPEGTTLVTQRDTVVGAAAPPPEAMPPAGPPPDRRVGADMLLALGAIALVGLGAALAWLLTHRGSSDRQVTTVVVHSGPVNTPTAAAKVAVPRLVGLKEQQALLRLAQVGLRPKEVFRPTKQAKDVVVAQKPQEARNLPKGSQVTLVIDSGAPRVAVPDLTGESFAQAQAALDKLGLDSTRTEVTSTEPAGTVVDQAPKAAAKVAKGSLV